MALELLKTGDRFTVSDTDLKGVDLPDPDTTYTLQAMTSDAMRALVKKHTSRALDPKSRAMVDKVDREAIQDDMVDYVVVDWTGIVYQGQPLACERQYKLRIDPVRKDALLTLAGMNQSRAAEVRAESFREPSGVV